MSMFEIERLTRENKKLQETVREQARIINSLQSAQSSSDIVGKNHAKERDVLLAQIKDLKRKIEEDKYQKEETENRYIGVLRKLEDELEQRKRKYQKLQSKIEPLINHDTVRLKILNQVEGAHFMELEQQKRKINVLKDEVLRLKRGQQLLKHQLQSAKIDHEQEMRKIKQWNDRNRSNDHLNQLTYEVCNEIENKLRANYEQARKQSQYYKDKYFTSERKYMDKISYLEKELLLMKEKQMILDSK